MIILLFLFSIFILFDEEVKSYHLHFINISHVAVLCILVPKCYINQDPLLKFYVSVYHHQPPPVLPWQLPENFQHDSVKLIFVTTCIVH